MVTAVGAGADGLGAVGEYEEESGGEVGCEKERCSSESRELSDDEGEAAAMVKGGSMTGGRCSQLLDLGTATTPRRLGPPTMTPCECEAPQIRDIGWLVCLL